MKVDQFVPCKDLDALVLLTLPETLGSFRKSLFNVVFHWLGHNVLVTGQEP